MSDRASHYFEHGNAQRWGVLPVTDRVRHDTACLWGRLQLNSRARVVDRGDDCFSTARGRVRLGWRAHLGAGQVRWAGRL